MPHNGLLLFQESSILPGILGPNTPPDQEDQKEPYQQGEARNESKQGHIVQGLAIHGLDGQEVGMVDDLVFEEAVALDSVLVHQPDQAMGVLRIQFGDKGVSEALLAIETGAELAQILAGTHTLLLFNQTGDTRLVELAQLVVLLGIDLAELSQVRVITDTLPAVAGTSLGAHLPRGTQTGVGVFFAIASGAGPSPLADALATEAVGALHIAIDALPTLAVVASVSHVTQTAPTVAVSVIRTDQRRSRFVQSGLPALVEKAFIGGEVRGILGAGAIGARPSLVAVAHSTVEVSLILASESSLLVVWVWFLATRTWSLKIHIQVHRLTK